jgi:hypothetical protein
VSTREQELEKALVEWNDPQIEESKAGALKARADLERAILAAINGDTP